MSEAKDKIKRSKHRRSARHLRVPSEGPVAGGVRESGRRRRLRYVTRRIRVRGRAGARADVLCPKAAGQVAGGLIDK